MRDDIQYILELKRIKINLLVEINRIEDLILNQITKDPNRLDRMVDEETLGLFDYMLCHSPTDKIAFGIAKLGPTSIVNLTKYLRILGEKTSEVKTKAWIKNTLHLMIREERVRSHEINGILIYTLNKKQC